MTGEEDREELAEAIVEASDDVLEATSHLEHTVGELRGLVREFGQWVAVLVKALERERSRGAGGPPEAGA